MLNAQTITWFLTGMFIMSYGSAISKLCVKKENANAKLKSRIIWIISLLFALLLVLSMPIGMRSRGDTLTEIVMHHHPNVSIMKQYEYNDYGVVYYKEKYRKNPIFTYYINDKGWRLENKNYYNHSFNDFEIQLKSKNKGIFISFNMLKSRNKTFVYFNCYKLKEEIVNPEERIYDSLFTNFEKIPTETGYVYIGVIDQIIDKKNYVITFNGDTYKWVP